MSQELENVKRFRAMLESRTDREDDQYLQRQQHEHDGPCGPWEASWTRKLVKNDSDRSQESATLAKAPHLFGRRAHRIAGDYGVMTPPSSDPEEARPSAKLRRCLNHVDREAVEE